MTMTAIAERRGAKLVRANGIDIAVRDLGSGPPLVLLHGALVSTGPTWVGSSVAHVDHLERLAKHFRVVAPDTRGSGATVHDGREMTLDLLAQDVVALMDALGLEKPLLAGFSEGGCIATIVALTAPDRIAALVNHSGSDYFDQPDDYEANFRTWMGGSPDAARADPDHFAQEFQGSEWGRHFLAQVQHDCDEAQGEGHWRVYLNQMFERSVRPLDYRTSDFQRITVPTLLLAGDRDHFCPSEMLVRAYRATPESELAIIPNTGHEITTLLMATMGSFLLRHAGQDHVDL